VDGFAVNDIGWGFSFCCVQHQRRAHIPGRRHLDAAKLGHDCPAERGHLDRRGRFVAVGDSGTILTSPDGFFWTPGFEFVPPA
jgi:hypothetical protein